MPSSAKHFGRLKLSKAVKKRSGHIWTCARFADDGHYPTLSNPFRHYLTISNQNHIQPTYFPILLRWIILSLTHYRQASGPRGAFKIYQLNHSLLSSPAHQHLKTAMTHQHSHLGIVSASYRYRCFGVTMRSHDHGACLNW
jgi:hypothetical protein